MGAIYDALISYLNEKELSFFTCDDATIALPYPGENAQYFCYATAREDRDQLIVYSYWQDTIPEGMRADVAEFVARANYGLVLGNFELNMDDGVVRYKTSIDLDGNSISDGQLDVLFGVNLRTLDRYVPGLRAVLYRDTPPALAIREVENEVEFQADVRSDIDELIEDLGDED